MTSDERDERLAIEGGTIDIRTCCPKGCEPALRGIVDHGQLGPWARCLVCDALIELCDAQFSQKHCVRRHGHKGACVSPSGSSWLRGTNVNEAGVPSTKVESEPVAPRPFYEILREAKEATRPDLAAAGTPAQVESFWQDLSKYVREVDEMTLKSWCSENQLTGTMLKNAIDGAYGPEATREQIAQAAEKLASEPPPKSYAELEASVQVWQARTEHARQQYAEVKGFNDGLATELADTKRKLEEAHAATWKLENEVQELVDRCENSDAAYVLAQGQRDRLLADVEELKASVEKHQTDAAGARAALAETERVWKADVARMAQIVDERENALRERRAAADVIRKLEGKLSASAQALHDAREDAKSLAEAKREIDDQRGRADYHQRLWNQSVEANEVLRKEVLDLRAQMEGLAKASEMDHLECKRWMEDAIGANDAHECTARDLTAKLAEKQAECTEYVNDLWNLKTAHQLLREELAEAKLRLSRRLPFLFVDAVRTLWSDK